METRASDFDLTLEAGRPALDYWPDLWRYRGRAILVGPYGHQATLEGGAPQRVRVGDSTGRC